MTPSRPHARPDARSLMLLALLAIISAAADPGEEEDRSTRYAVVLRVRDGEAAIDWGGASGLRVGDVLEIRREGEDLRYPGVEEPIGRDTVRVGRVRIRIVEERYSIVEPIEGEPAPAVGDRAYRIPEPHRSSPEIPEREGRGRPDGMERTGWVSWEEEATDFVLLARPEAPPLWAAATREGLVLLAPEEVHLREVSRRREERAGRTLRLEAGDPEGTGNPDLFWVRQEGEHVHTLRIGVDPATGNTELRSREEGIRIPVPGGALLVQDPPVLPFGPFRVGAGRGDGIPIDGPVLGLVPGAWRTAGRTEWLQIDATGTLSLPPAGELPAWSGEGLVLRFRRWLDRNGGRIPIPHAIAAIDVDGDGRDEIAVARPLLAAEDEQPPPAIGGPDRIVLLAWTGEGFARTWESPVLGGPVVNLRVDRSDGTPALVVAVLARSRLGTRTLFQRWEAAR